MRRKIYFLVLLIIVFLLFGDLLASNKLSTDGEKIKTLGGEINRLEAENASLELKIAQTASISGIIERAESLGFVRSPNVFYLKGEFPVAMR
jgi:hypothetical protein